MGTLQLYWCSFRFLAGYYIVKYFIEQEAIIVKSYKIKMLEYNKWDITMAAVLRE